MSGSQMALCYRVLKNREIVPVLEYGITVDDFISADAKMLWTAIITEYTHPHSQGSILDPGRLAGILRGFVLGDSMDGQTLQSLCADVRKQRIRAESNKALVDCSTALSQYDVDPMGPLAELDGRLTNLQALGISANTDVSWLRGLTNIRQKMALAKQGVDFSKMSWPWQPLQDETFGIQPDDYIVFYGRPKSMKSWVLASLIAWAWEQEKRIVIYTKEMTPDNIHMRTLACVLKSVYTELRGAVMSKYRPLSQADEQRFNDLIAYTEKDPNLANLITVLNGREAGSGLDTVPWLRSKLEKYKPELVFIDGMYLMADHHKVKADHERVRNISRDLRETVLATNTPIITTLQANRKAAGHSEANLDEIGFSDALGQDATIAARVINDKASPTVSIVIGGSREFEMHGFRINAVPARDFTFHSLLDENEIKKATEADRGEEEKKEAKEAKKAKKSAQADLPKDTSKADEDQAFERELGVPRKKA